MKTSQLISLATFVLGSQALVAAPKDASYEKRQIGTCMIGVDSPCNGDAADANGQDGKTWENWHKFHNGKDQEKREADAAATPTPTPTPAPVSEKREADPEAIGICVIGVDSPCNGDAWDKNGKDGKTWENWHRFYNGKEEEKREADAAPTPTPTPTPAPAPAPAAVE